MVVKDPLKEKIRVCKYIPMPSLEVASLPFLLNDPLILLWGKGWSDQFIEKLNSEKLTFAFYKNSEQLDDPLALTRVYDLVLAHQEMEFRRIEGTYVDSKNEAFNELDEIISCVAPTGNMYIKFHIDACGKRAITIDLAHKLLFSFEYIKFMSSEVSGKFLRMAYFCKHQRTVCDPEYTYVRSARQERWLRRTR